ncbi:hypothetical protein [Sphingomonas sp. ID0503]|uniref:hypothetical protein n=1 Tax=Sphingomonas sp. ID0503 TaxID=3399691 RepID=UPI003AFAC738
MVDENELPEGTDTIVGDDATASTEETAGAQPKSQDAFQKAKDAFKSEADGLRGQAGDTLRAYATQGKDKTTEALDNIVKMVSDAADSVEEKLGGQYAGFARNAASSISGVADTLRDKEVDDLVEDARAFVAASPAIAIGAAAAIGFVLARVLKAAPEREEA